MYKFFIWLLKLGSFINFYFLVQTVKSPLQFIDPHLLIPAQILFIVSAYRCFFPVSYVTNAVLHKSFFSSVFLTRFLATFVEVAYIYQFSYLIRLINSDQIPLVDVLSWLMVLQVVVSQFFVWGAILTQKQTLYFYEELGWGGIFFINAVVSAILYGSLGSLGAWKLLLELNLLFGALYLPWQYFHLKALRSRAMYQKINENMHTDISWSMLKQGLYQSIQVKNLTTHPEDWGGVIGMIWMIGYWATLIPAWLYLIIRTA